jgi:hypothetical protein
MTCRGSSVSNPKGRWRRRLTPKGRRLSALAREAFWECERKGFDPCTAMRPLMVGVSTLAAVKD